MYKTESSFFQMMEDFSGLALPPLFGGHILEAELEPGGVELGPGEVMFMITVMRIGMVIPVKVGTRRKSSLCHKVMRGIVYSCLCANGTSTPVLTPTLSPVF